MKQDTQPLLFLTTRSMLIFMIIGWGCLSPAWAALVMIEKDGPTVSSRPYLQAMKLPTEKSTEQVKQHQALFQQPITLSPVTTLYPIQSTLTVGKVTTHRVDTPRLFRPLFLIGDDPFSVQWASYHATEFKRIHAIGLVTNVRDAARLQAMEEQTGLLLLPVNITGIKERLHVSHYPFLWTTQGVEQ